MPSLHMIMWKGCQIGFRENQGDLKTLNQINVILIIRDNLTASILLFVCAF